MASLESFGVDEYGNGNGVNLPDFTGCLLLATTPTPPAGTLVADGSEVSREAYSKLFAIFGESQGAGDGVTTFNLPDWRDEFPRFSGAARTVLTTQGDTIRNIHGSLAYVGSISPPTNLSASLASGAFHAANLPGTIGPTSYSTSTTETTAYSGLVNFDASQEVPTADENRPRNVAFLPCVIYV